MIKIIVTVTAFLISLISFAQVSENRTVGDFSKLQVSNAIEVFYTVSNTKSVKVETDEKENLKYIKAIAENGTLKLFVDTSDYKKEKNSKKRSKGKNVNWINGVEFAVLKITISGPNLEAIKASSSADIKIENTNTSSNLDIAVSSSGSISGNFNCTNLTIDASSSGDFTGKIDATSAAIESSSSSDVNLSGKATKISVKASSSSDCNLKDFMVEEAIIGASSSADVSIKVTKSIEAKATSSASIEYFGNPSAVKKEESSSGSVKNK
ncbi:DUF2807 domain-containing protein [Flavobacterium jejuense]|uniref:DUF2807 domain-containing protein n=1 Tax=Flavobacterium jejuense TaxID=1544455 RepID=A0ABX0IT52_9FLAO|nr:head GIN domain-containing protein [Flavobacterium jejuense]NHN27044.1 DUF2807 domain-containing protein [Flavobacterium jejuense]